MAAIVAQFISKLWDAASFYLARPRSGVEDLGREAELLGAKLKDVDRVINEAAGNGQTVTEEARVWKGQAEVFVSKEAAIQRDYQAMRCLGGWSWNCVCINLRVDKNMKRTQDLISRPPPPPPPPPQQQQPQSVGLRAISNKNIVGMQSNVIQIVNQIRDENASVIGIYGMGGIGKTTLLTLIHNHEEISKLQFEHVVWIVASKGCKLQMLQMDLAEKVRLNLKDDESEDDRASNLCNFLKKKNCLLFLDDIWEFYDLVKLGMEQVPAEHGKKQKRKVVVFTTRSEQVCTEMSANVIKKVEGLPYDQAWELFLKNAGENVINSEPRITQLAKQIAEECAGVPLALITVGKTMSAKKRWEAWNDALTQLRQSQMPKVTGMQERDPMFAVFKLSFGSLEDDNMRARLLCCSLWPEDFKIDKDELIQCWIGLGLIDEFGSINKAFHRGHSHIETLTSACLLELINGEVHTANIKMHDVIRDMALWMASDCGSNQHRWIVRARAGLSQLELKNEECQVVERASFMHNKLDYLPEQTATFPKLSVLMLQWNKFLDFPKSFFSSLPVLTFLDLSNTKIRKLPSDINMLSELQHLNLSFTRVEALPVELSSLAKLKYLLLEGTQRLVQVPKGTISNLPLLKLLDLYESSYADLDELEGFQGCRKNIGITLDSMTDLKQLSSLSQLSTWKLQLQNIKDLAYPSQLFENIMSSYNTSQDLERLEIINVRTDGGLTVVRSNKNHKEGLECLRYMALINVHFLQEITWIAVEPQTIFPNLHELTINKCHELINITWVLQLPNLTVLNVSNCYEMKELISCVETSVNSSISLRPSIGLRLLTLERLPNLKYISRQSLTFPYLEGINVEFCPKLKKLPFGAEIRQDKLKRIRGTWRWWENIQWEDVNDKNSLSPLFEADNTHYLRSFFVKLARSRANSVPGKFSIGCQNESGSTLMDNSEA